VCDFKNPLFSTKERGCAISQDLKTLQKPIDHAGDLFIKILEKRGITPALYESEADALISSRGGKRPALPFRKTAFFNIDRHKPDPAYLR
jgi:hypothetical protein